MLQLLTTPGTSYLDAVLTAIRQARRATLISAFVSPAGVDELTPALEALLAVPLASARIVIGLDKQGFNGISVVEKLVELRKRSGPRLEIKVVLERAGLLHAKGLLAESPRGTELIVGSANLTQRALHSNHELALHVLDCPTALVRAFNTFERSLFSRTLEDTTADAILSALGKRVRTPAGPRTADLGWWQDIEKALGASPPGDLREPAEGFIKSWIDRGHLVRLGRRPSEVLAIRLPLDSLAERGLIKKVRRRSLGSNAREHRTLGYVIDLLPSKERVALRKALKRVNALAPRLSLQLQCFGLWMPETYWPVFETARDQLLSADALDRDTIRSAAEQHSKYLLREGGLDDALTKIIDRLSQEAELAPSNGSIVRDELEIYAREQLANRTPDLVAQVVDFRAGRQHWSPYESSEWPYRQLLVDIVQSLFSTTQRTGRWPRVVRSYAARALLDEAERVLVRDEDHADRLALEMLAYTSTWESDRFTLNDVLKRFRSLVPEDFTFPVPDPAELVASIAKESEEEDDEDL